MNNLDDPPPLNPPLAPNSQDSLPSNLPSVPVPVLEQYEEKLSNIESNLQSTDVKPKFEKMVSIDKNFPVEQG